MEDTLTASTSLEAPRSGQELAAESGNAVEAASQADAAVRSEEPRRTRNSKAAGKRRKRTGVRKNDSRRAASESEAVVPPSPEDLERVTSSRVREALELGHPVEGTVIGWNQGGFHVVVDGMSGFCPRSLMELGPPHEPGAYLDRMFVFRILRVEERGHRLVLSRAAMLREERRQQVELLLRSLQVDQVVPVQVVALADFGAFVDLGGVEGLIHVSEFTYGRVQHPSEVVKVGDRFDAKVLKLPKGNERVSLSRKALLPDPWTGVSERYSVGQKVRGRVLRTTDFGVFVELEPGVEGLLHRSRLPKGSKAARPTLELNSELDFFVIEVDPSKCRIALALEATPTTDPWTHVLERYAEGTVHEGSVARIEKKGVVVELEPGLSGLLPSSELGLPREANLARVYPKDKKVKVQVASIDTRRRRISLTLEGKALEGSRSDYREYLKSLKKSSGLGTMASALAQLRRS